MISEVVMSQGQDNLNINDENDDVNDHGIVGNKIKVTLKCPSRTKRIANIIEGKNE